MGTETIDGKTTNKYRIVYKIADKEDSIFQWVATDSGFSIKTSAVDGSWTMEYKNLKIGKQSDSLFEIQAGYQKMSHGMPTIPKMKPAEKSTEEKQEEPKKSLSLKIPKLW